MRMLHSTLLPSVFQYPSPLYPPASSNAKQLRSILLVHLPCSSFPLGLSRCYPTIAPVLSPSWIALGHVSAVFVVNGGGARRRAIPVALSVSFRVSESIRLFSPSCCPCRFYRQRSELIVDKRYDWCEERRLTLFHSSNVLTMITPQSKSE